MARYKAIDTSPRFLAVDLEKQLLPGSFEFAVNHLLEHEFDLSLFDGRYRNDQTGARPIGDRPRIFPRQKSWSVPNCPYSDGTKNCTRRRSTILDFQDNCLIVRHRSSSDAIDM